MLLQSASWYVSPRIDYFQAVRAVRHRPTNATAVFNEAQKKDGISNARCSAGEGIRALDIQLGKISETGTENGLLFEDFLHFTMVAIGWQTRTKAASIAVDKSTCQWLKR